MAARRNLIRIPYVRTRSYLKSWKIKKYDQGYALEGEGYWIGRTGMRVGQPAAVYIGGDPEGKQQSWMHRGRWPLVANAVQEVTANLPEELRGDLAITARRYGYPWE